VDCHLCIHFSPFVGINALSAFENDSDAFAGRHTTCVPQRIADRLLRSIAGLQVMTRSAPGHPQAVTMASAPPCVHMGGVHRPTPKAAMWRSLRKRMLRSVQSHPSGRWQVPRRARLSGWRRTGRIPIERAVQTTRAGDTNNTRAIGSSPLVADGLAARTAISIAAAASFSRQRPLPAVTVRSGH